MVISALRLFTSLKRMDSSSFAKSQPAKAFLPELENVLSFISFMKISKAKVGVTLRAEVLMRIRIIIKYKYISSFLHNAVRFSSGVTWISLQIVITY